MTAFAVLHVTSMPGGGVNRHIDDVVAAGLRRHLVWHVAPGADVIAIPAEKRFVPLDPDAIAREPGALADWLRGQGVGAVHVHSVAPAPRARAAWAAQALGVPTLATLHDVLFMRLDGFAAGAPPEPDPEWLAQTQGFLEAAAARIAPSEFLAGLARRHLDQEVVVIPNGSLPAGNAAPLAPRPEFLARKPAHVVAVIGAIGPHKGARIIEETARLLEGSDIGIVVVGYMDHQVAPGWRAERLFVHGPWSERDGGPLAKAYGAEIALFPHQVPESFSYALSDAWAAGLPALVAPDGALGERMSRHQAGWLLPERFTAVDVAAELRRIFSAAGADDLARVRSRLSGDDPHRVPSVDAMNRSLDALYARFGIDPRAPLEPLSAPVQAVIAAHLDGKAMRPELSQLADEVAQLRAGLEVERGQAQRFETEAREWIAKLEADVANVQEELRRETAERLRLAEENRELRLQPRFLRRIASFARRLLKRNPDARG
ncbi:MAG TPA: glycosyltransferase [Usitatibacter sp.]|nr:glycosyltransferase [Usitatibacter sp.]